jgi:hypothetical protein
MHQKNSKSIRSSVPVTVCNDTPTFPTPTALATWLHIQGIDTTAWGQADAKTVAALWQEIQQGECTLQAAPVVRVVQVVEVRIERDGKLLCEMEQQFADGRVRIRNRPPSEKMLPGEDPTIAARRCLIEELAVPATAITFPPAKITQRSARDESGSYPNLTSAYTFYTVHTHVDGLPDTKFTTANAAHSEGDPIIAHTWDWVAV